MIAFERFFNDPRYEVGVLVTGTQMGKTDAFLDVIGWQLDTRPRPILYAGPSKDFVKDQFEPRLMDLFRQSSRLAGRVALGQKNKAVLKIVNGVQLRLGWAGSATSLSSDQAGVVFLDEYSKMFRQKQKGGDPFVLAKARADSYADRKIAVASTPENGSVPTERDAASGLEFWKKVDPENIECATWRRWQTGTRHHLAWRCPHCSEWFIPRYRDLRWPEGATPGLARRETYICCPSNGCVITEAAKEEMNAGAQYVAPGEFIRPDGTIGGDPEDVTTISWWASGLASPMMSWGERVEEILNAKLAGDESAVKAAYNKLGELFSPLPATAIDDETVASRIVTGFRLGDVPAEVMRLTLGADVQGNRIVYVVRGWGAQARSWLINYGEVWGPTRDEDVWGRFGLILQKTYDGLRVERALIDSGFRPDKKEAGDYHKVYDFCRRWNWIAMPTKGKDHQSSPVVISQIEVTAEGKKETYGLNLAKVDTDYFKSLVHSRLWTPLGQPGSFVIPEEVSESYKSQLVSEYRGEDGVWHQTRRENHFFDAEVLAAVGGFLIKTHTIPQGVKRDVGDQRAQRQPTSSPAEPPPPKSLRERMAERAARANRRT